MGKIKFDYNNFVIDDVLKQYAKKHKLKKEPKKAEGVNAAAPAKVQNPYIRDVMVKPVTVKVSV